MNFFLLIQEDIKIYFPIKSILYSFSLNYICHNYDSNN